MKHERFTGDTTTQQDQRAPQLRTDMRPPTDTVDLTELFRPNEDAKSSLSPHTILSGSWGKLLNIVPVPILMLDESGTIVWGNEACVHTIPDFPRLLNQPFSTLFPDPDTAAASEAILANIRNSGKGGFWEAGIGTEELPLWMRLTFRRAKVRDTFCLIVILEDLSKEKRRRQREEQARMKLKQKAVLCTREVEELIADLQEQIKLREHAQQVLAESERRYRKFFEDIPLLYAIIQDRDGEPMIAEVNDLFLRRLKYSREEAIGRSPWMFYTPESLKAMQETQGYARALAGDFFIGERELVAKDGEIVPVLVYSVPARDDEGKVVGVHAMLVDITERKRAEKALQKSETKFRRLFTESRDGVYFVTRDGTILDANPAFVELFGYTREEILKMNMKNLYLNPADRSLFIEAIERQGFVKDYEVKFRKKDRSIMHCLLTASVDYGENGTVVGYQGIMRDVTATKDLQRQLFQAQKMEALGTLAGGIAHDFNNLLTVIRGFSELLLLERDEQDPLYQDLKKIHDAAVSGAELVKRILLFSYRMDIDPRTVQLNEVILETEKILSRLIPKMVSIQLELDPDLALVMADPVLVEQVLFNLAVNARDAMPDGGVLRIRTENFIADEETSRWYVGMKPGRYVLLSVSDTGIGMDEKTLEHIFDPFFTTKEKGRGTGLGLTTVYRIVKEHNGIIRCESTPGKGSTFRMYFPAWNTEYQHPEAETAILETPTAGGTILLVDDEEPVRNVAQRLLERAGYTVLPARNGLHALELYHRHKDEIALVILDIIMPVMGGKACLEQLLRENPYLPVLVATGHIADDDTRQYLKAKASGFVSKPYNLKELLVSVRKVLSSSPEQKR